MRPLVAAAVVFSVSMIALAYIGNNPADRNEEVWQEAVQAISETL